MWAMLFFSSLLIALDPRAERPLAASPISYIYISPRQLSVQLQAQAGSRYRLLLAGGKLRLTTENQAHCCHSQCRQ
ncbi:hypothetical protein BQ8794_60305 [Mesorhizobium prunaredense]|uniref:Uncharacterized protein n=1 Tax=Mesorhizobium prunaredense TaxID=1631249 RepID=A0A1R3VJE4_9HYPH|nr:hypothetical protein BQ8794_60305 [Mesorhizobium prunaredense]